MLVSTWLLNEVFIQSADRAAVEMRISSKMPCKKRFSESTLANVTPASVEGAAGSGCFVQARRSRDCTGRCRATDLAVDRRNRYRRAPCTGGGPAVVEEDGRSRGSRASRSKLMRVQGVALSAISCTRFGDGSQSALVRGSPGSSMVLSSVMTAPRRSGGPCGEDSRSAPAASLGGDMLHRPCDCC